MRGREAAEGEWQFRGRCVLKQLKLNAQPALALGLIYLLLDMLSLSPIFYRILLLIEGQLS